MSATATEQLPPLTVEEIAGRFLEPVERVRGWITRGVRTPGGRAHLRASVVDGVWQVDPEDLVAFIRRQHPDLGLSDEGG